MWRANAPSSMNRASALCAIIAVCQSVTCFALFAASRSDGGTTMKPSRRVGSNVFEKRADIHNAAGRIEGLKRLERTPAEAKLAVIVVLNNDRVGVLGPGKQRASTRQAHGDAEGIVMRWRHVDGPGLGRQRLHDQALAVDGHTY